MNDIIQLDLLSGQSLKSNGVALVESHNLDFVEQMRAEAIRLAKLCGSVSCDQLRAYAAQHDIKPNHPNAWGAIFKGPDWQLVGRRQSKLKSNHAREIKVWALKH